MRCCVYITNDEYHSDVKWIFCDVFGTGVTRSFLFLKRVVRQKKVYDNNHKTGDHKALITEDSIKRYITNKIE